MNNLHRELAPISEAAWAQIEQEASRTLKRYLAGRRVVDVLALHIIDRLTIQFERDTQLHQRLRIALPGADVFSRRFDMPQVASADGGEGDAIRSMHRCG